LGLLSASIRLYQFLQPAIGVKASSWKHNATGEALIKPLSKGFSWILLQWIREDRKFPQDQGNRMLSWPRCESKARWRAPIKKKAEEKIWGRSRKG
jgi:hypothetical protein